MTNDMTTKAEETVNSVDTVSVPNDNIPDIECAIKNGEIASDIFSGYTDDVNINRLEHLYHILIDNNGWILEERLKHAKYILPHIISDMRRDAIERFKNSQ